MKIEEIVQQIYKQRHPEEVFFRELVSKFEIKKTSRYSESVFYTIGDVVYMELINLKVKKIYIKHKIFYDITKREEKYHNKIKFLEYSNTITDKDSINILPNSDIFFDDSVLELKNMKDKDFVTLTRWNLDPNTKKAEFFNVNCSQDVWVWKGIVEPGEMNIDWYMGKPGIDNLLCGAFHEAGFRVLNPSLLIKTYHLHQQITRDYSDKDVVLGRLYVLYPTDNMNESKIGFWKDTTNFKA
jgi:hypothetical protein